MKAPALFLAALLASPLALAQQTSPAAPGTSRLVPPGNNGTGTGTTPRPARGPDAAQPRGFARADTNKDGAISREEAQARFNQRFDAMDKNHDGKVTPEEMRASRDGARAERTGQMQARMDDYFKRVDTNHDGRLSRDEVNANMPRLARDFDRLDANHDGQLTQDEIRAGMRERRPGGRPDGVAPNRN